MPKKAASSPAPSNEADVPEVAISEAMLRRAADLAVRGRKWSQIAQDLNLDPDEIRREMSAGRGHAMIQESRAELEASIDLLHVNLKQAALTTLGQGLRAERVVHVSESGDVTKVEDWPTRTAAARTIMQTPVIEITQTTYIGIGAGEDEHLEFLALRAEAVRDSLADRHVIEGDAVDQDTAEALPVAERATGTD